MKIFFAISILFYLNVTTAQDLHPKIAGGGGEGGGVSSEGDISSGSGSKVSVALTEYDRDMIAHGIECANSVGAVLPANKTINSIASALESKISSAKPSRGIASEPSQSCHIFSSQTTSAILKRKYIREEVLPSVATDEAQKGSDISK